ncbi:MAG: UDP-2,3-diacylglucosamine diphosphatase [Burkholderiales bacterium]|nr:UDP-2,3-diacylglucosamine diphosphatase [Burkholderiales bacterium]
MGAGPAFTLFISDLHLTDARPDLTDLLLRFLEQSAPQAEALYVLGDLFEFWLGDDTLDEPLNASVVRALRRLSDGGTRLAFMQGNRDFLAGTGFAAAVGATLLPDPTLVDLYGVPTLLLHGDTLCTDDVAYQAFRRQVRNPMVQQQFLSLPLAARRQQVGQVRAQSEEQKQVKAMEIMDVTSTAVDDAIRAAGFPPRLIHGHTHRPARHEHRVDGHRCERWVLADWNTHGEALRVDASGIARLPIT